MKDQQYEKLEPGFIGSLILTSEHILDKVSGTVPVAGLFISAVGALASLVWYRKSLSPWQKGARLLLAGGFAALGAVVLTFPFTGLAVGLGIATFSVVSNLYENIAHARKNKRSSQNNEHQSHDHNDHHKAAANQNLRNSIMSMVSLACIVTALMVPPIAPAVLGVFITSTLVYLALTVTQNKWRRLGSKSKKNQVNPQSESNFSKNDKQQQNIGNIEKKSISKIAHSQKNPSLATQNINPAETPKSSSTDAESQQRNIERADQKWAYKAHKADNNLRTPRPTHSDSISDDDTLSPNDSEQDDDGDGEHIRLH